MASDPFPKARVILDDPTGLLDLPADRKAFVRLSFANTEVDCPIIHRIVLGQDRDAVEGFLSSSRIPAPRRASSSSRMGFGEVVTIAADSTATSVEDKFIMLADVVREERPEGPIDVATRVVVVSDPNQMSNSDQQVALQLQINCTAALNDRHQTLLKALKAT